jgi:hypothetical protein
VHAHPAAVEHAHAGRGRRLEEGGLHGRIDDVGRSTHGLERRHRNGTAGKAAHAHVRGVDDAVGVRDVALEVAGEAAT